MQTIGKLQTGGSCCGWMVSFGADGKSSARESSAPPGCSGASSTSREAFTRRSSTSCEAFTRRVYWRVGDGNAQGTGLVTDMHKIRKIISPFITQAVPLNCHSFHCYAKEKEKFTFEDKTVFLFEQSHSLCNSSLNGKVQLEPGTCCLQKYHVMGKNVKCRKWH